MARYFFNWKFHIFSNFSPHLFQFKLIAEEFCLKTFSKFGAQPLPGKWNLTWILSCVCDNQKQYVFDTNYIGDICR